MPFKLIYLKGSNFNQMGIEKMINDFLKSYHMKNFLQSLFLVFSLILVASCSSEDPEPPHIVGDWTYEALNATNLPDAYSAWDEIPYNHPGYDIEINDDGSFVERIKRSGQSSLILPGQWTLSDDGSDLDLVYDDEDNGEFSYNVEKNELDALHLAWEISDLLISNNNLDKLVEDHGSIQDGFTYLDSLDPNNEDDAAILEEFYDVVNFDLRFSLIRAD